MFHQIILQISYLNWNYTQNTLNLNNFTHMIHHQFYIRQNIYLEVNKEQYLGYLYLSNSLFSKKVYQCSTIKYLWHLYRIEYTPCPSNLNWKTLFHRRSKYSNRLQSHLLTLFCNFIIYGIWIVSLLQCQNS